MKNLFTISLLCATALSSYGKGSYKIDLRNVDTPSLQYLKMGNPGVGSNKLLVNNLYMEVGGKPQLPVMGEFHYNRLDERYWRDALLKMKSTGINIVSTYILWVLHEEFEGRQNWTGRNDLRAFVQLCQELGLQVHLRIGPYCNAEIRNGGFPDWMIQSNEFKARTNDPKYLEYVKYWYEGVYDQVGDLMYKDGGPVIGLQLENEYVTEGMVVSHILNLKKIAIDTGFDVPIYSMTHWMMSDYPKGEVIPYAGYYLETPWIYNGDKENPTTNAEFYSYNRISDNIGNDFIKRDGAFESLTADSNESPYLTCENGLGTPNYYSRRAVVPEEMAGENINLRLGCGVNLMGYYMYVGQTNPIGERYVLHRQTARVSNDYQAPIREFGTMGCVMKETKKLNYLMNDFGGDIAPLVAYLPEQNKDTANLQWSVRSDGEKGYLFCSNYLYKHDRKDYKQVQFTLSLKDEQIKLPQKPVTVKNGVYFLWPFNQNYGGVELIYATAQPVCTHKENGVETFFFFEDDFIPGEFRLSSENIRSVKVNNAQSKKQSSSYFIDNLNAGKDCVIEITRTDGKLVRFVTLTETESDLIWKGEVNNKDYVLLSEATVVADKGALSLTTEMDTLAYWIYEDGKFVEGKQLFEAQPQQPKVKKQGPFQRALRIAPKSGDMLKRTFDASSLAKVEKATLRVKSQKNVDVTLNESSIQLIPMSAYALADVTSLCENGLNTIEISSVNPEQGVEAEVEVLFADGARRVYSTDNLWSSGSEPLVSVLNKTNETSVYDSKEHLSVYSIDLSTIDLAENTPMRIYINFEGDIANAYIHDQLIHDKFNNGDAWIIGVDRYKHLFGNKSKEIVVRIDGLKSKDAPIYFEKFVNKAGCVDPKIQSVTLGTEKNLKIKN